MYKALSAGAIGVHAHNLQNALHLANQYGFQGLEFSAGEVADLIDQHGVNSVRDLFAQADVKPSGWGLPTEWRHSEEKWREELNILPRLARAAREIGGTRTFTWILPFSDERDWEANLAHHIERLMPIARVLNHEGVQFGLEFVGPKTMRAPHAHEFIHTMAQMFDMSRQIGPNVGLLIDCWHWYTSHGTVAELHNITADQVVYVHVNDAPAGVDVDEQVDHVRAIPGSTGVIDITGFLGALQAVGYDGPIVAEPFSQELRDLPDDAARLQTISQSLDKILANLQS